MSVDGSARYPYRSRPLPSIRVVVCYFSGVAVASVFGVTWSADVIFTDLPFIEQQPPPSFFTAFTVLNAAVPAVVDEVVEQEAAALSVEQLAPAVVAVVVAFVVAQ